MKKTIQIQRTAHYYLQIPQKPIESVLFVIHGFGQLAAEFIEEFSHLKESSTLIVAPEAISKIYNKNRLPAANWMTSHEREDEIHDYINYLNQVEEEIENQFGKLDKHALGFSQGVSTLFRWVAQSQTPPNKIFACSGSIPPELTKDAVSSLLSSQIYYYYGDQDGLQPIENALKQIEFLKELGLRVSSVPYHGRHEVSQETKTDLTTLKQSGHK